MANDILRNAEVRLVVADASTCETCGRPRGSKSVENWCPAEGDYGCLLVASLSQRQRAAAAEKRAEAAEAELTTARELVAVLEERADHLAGELADREERIEQMRRPVHGVWRALERDLDDDGKAGGA